MKKALIFLLIGIVANIIFFNGLLTDTSNFWNYSFFAIVGAISFIVCIVIYLKANNEKQKQLMKEREQTKLIEYRRKCNSCNNIYFYTQRDLDENKHLQTGALLSSAAALTDTLFGNRMVGAVNSIDSDNKSSRIVDYNKCPKCNSIDTKILSDREWEVEKKTLNTPKVNASAVSSADELLKFKSLLESGVITQEEFDEKKKQLLGL